MGYNLINWENSPSKQTPINAENLNQMDVNIAKAIQGTRFNFSATFTADNVLKNTTSTEALGAGSFATSQTDIVTVFVADNVTKIDSGAFSGCTSLKTIYIDNTVGNVEIVSGAIPDGVSIVYSNDDNFINVNELLASAIKSLKSSVNTNRTDWENRATSIETQHKTDVQALADKANSIVDQANTDRQNFNNSVDEINTTLDTKENVSNKVSEITHPSLDYYPDTKAVFDYVNSKLEVPLAAIESLKADKLDKTDFNSYKTSNDNAVDEINTTLDTKENVSNKVSEITHPSLDYYPDTKAVFDYVNSKLEAPLADIETLKNNKVNITDFNTFKDTTNQAVANIEAYIGSITDVAGLCVDYKNKTFTRLADAVGLSAGSDFDKWKMYGGRKRCNVADDGTILAYYGDANYKEDGSNGQVMVYQPKFYYLIVPINYDVQETGVGYHLRKANYYVSEKARTGFRLHPAFYDANGNELDYILMGAYEACLYDTSASEYITDDAQVMTVGEDKLSSIAGVKPVSGSAQNLTRPNIETMAQNRGANWHGSTVKIASMNQLLCMIEMGTMNFQSAIGRGVVSYAAGSGNKASNTGATSSLGNGTGQATQTTHISSDGTETIDTTSGKLSVSYRGLENPWGNISEFEYGVNIWGNGSMAGGEPYVADDFNFAENKKTDNYEGAGFTVTNAGGYISAMGYSTACDWLFMASETAGNSSLPVGDGTSVVTNLKGYKIARLGGWWADNSSAGGFYWCLDTGVGVHAGVLGGRLVYVPTATA